MRALLSALLLVGACRSEPHPADRTTTLERPKQGPSPTSAPLPATDVTRDGPEPRLPTPQVEASDDDAPGCTMERIRAVVAPRLSAVKACYRAAAQADPSVRGRLSVELGIERDGRLLNRSVHESALPIEVNACVIAALEGLRFPGRFDTPCVVVYPFVFSASPAPR